MKSWNRKLLLSELSNTVVDPVDIFICSASYEERCKSAADALAQNVEIKRSLVCFNRKSSPAVSRNAAYLADRLGANAVKVSLDKTNPIKTADMLQSVLSRVGDERRVLRYLVDITTFTHEALLILLRILQTSVTARSLVTLIYSPAAEYAVGLAENEKWLSKGIENIRSVLGYPGNIRASRKSHLIILVGFESDRAEKLLDEYQPTAISLGFGKEGSATAPEHQDLNRKVFRELAKKVVNYNEFEFSCVDVSQSEAVIKEQVSKFADYNIVVAPMNTKLSTVGVAGAAFRNEEVQLCYASAAQYNIEGYSRPGIDCILVDLPAKFWKNAQK